MFLPIFQILQLLGTCVCVWVINVITKITYLLTYLIMHFARSEETVVCQGCVFENSVSEESSLSKHVVYGLLVLLLKLNLAL